ncbi:MAG TPA: metal-sensing transcriptional repressor [Gammaproteobacteria bacterium]|nr:metal-sensing transcriptional repressor [Gammaproteobacteria bacterium]
MAGHCESLQLSGKTRTEARQRLLSIKGHVEGITRMLDDEAIYCVDALKQIKAVEGALRKVSSMILRSHLQDHVVSAAQRGDTEEIVDELMEILKYR